MYYRLNKASGPPTQGFRSFCIQCKFALNRLMLVLVTAQIGSLWVDSANAQEPWNQQLGFFLFATPQPAGLNLIIGVQEGYWTPALWQEVPHGIDLYRRPMDLSCAVPEPAFERINSEPLPWIWESLPPDGTGFEFLDMSVDEGHAYEYMVRAVDAERNLIAEDPDTSMGFASYGEALIGHGEIVMAPDPCGSPFDVPAYIRCEAECLPYLRRPWPPENLDPFVDSGQTVRLYGSISTGYIGCENGITNFAVVSRVEPSTCLVGVEKVTWTASKRIYR